MKKPIQVFLEKLASSDQILTPEDQKCLKGGNDNDGDTTTIIVEEIVDH